MLCSLLLRNSNDSCMSACKTMLTQAKKQRQQFLITMFITRKKMRNANAVNGNLYLKKLLHPMPKIQIIFGPMFSGKTTELMRRLKRYQVAMHKCLVIKYAKDVRYDSENLLCTHDRQTLAAVSVTALTDLRKHAQQYSIIGIDEGQFFPDTVEFAEAMANSGKVVVVAALDGTYLRQGFGNILSLVPLAESVVKLTAVCMSCYSDASYTKRTTLETAVEVIGGSDKYIAVCRECYHKNTPVKSSPTPLKDWNERLVSQACVGMKKLEFDSTSSENDKENEISLTESS